MGYGHNFGVFADQLFILLRVQRTIGLYVDEVKLYAFLLQHLPRHEVAVVLHYTEDYFVAAIQAAEGGESEYVERFGCVLCKYYFPAFRAYESRSFVARAFVCRSGLFAQLVYASVYVRIMVLVVVRNLVYNL